MAQFPGYLRPQVPAAASSRPGSLLDILGALGPREPASGDRLRNPRPAVRDRPAAATRGVGAASAG